MFSLFFTFPALLCQFPSCVSLILWCSAVYSLVPHQFVYTSPPFYQSLVLSLMLLFLSSLPHVCFQFSHPVSWFSRPFVSCFVHPSFTINTSLHLPVSLTAGSLFSSYPHCKCCFRAAYTWRKEQGGSCHGGIMYFVNRIQMQTLREELQDFNKKWAFILGLNAAETIWLNMKHCQLWWV